MSVPRDPSWRRMGDFQLGDWFVQPSLNRLSRDRQELRLEPKLIDVLVFLAWNEGAVVSKEELLEAVWGRPFLAESVLTRAVAELRRALGDDARAPTVLETIRKRGYRIVAPVEVVSKPHVHRATPVPDLEDCEDVPVNLSWGERTIPLREGEHLIGRAEDAALRIASTRASRYHARLVVKDTGATVEDLGSKNGTFLRGRRIDGVTNLLDGDDLVIGGEVFIVRVLVPSGTTATGAEE